MKELLDQLTIDRGSSKDVSKKTSYKLYVAIVIFVVSSAILYGVFFGRVSAKTDLDSVHISDVKTPDVKITSESTSTNNVSIAQGNNIQASISEPTIKPILDASGYVVARRIATVSSKVTGKVVGLYVEEGMQVEEGQILALLDNSREKIQQELELLNVRSTKATSVEIEEELKIAVLSMERQKSLKVKSLTSEENIDNAITTVNILNAKLDRVQAEAKSAERLLALRKQELLDLEIRAPFSGVVVAKAAQLGEMISPTSAGGGFTRTGICTIVDMSTLEIEVDVSESFINRVQVGQKVIAKLNAYPEEDIDAEVAAIIPTANRAKASVRVRIKILSSNNKIMPDMGVKVAFYERT